MCEKSTFATIVTRRKKSKENILDLSKIVRKSMQLTTFKKALKQTF